MKLSVIIVNYNVKFYLEQCLRSLQKATEGIDTEIIVVDNHSHDGSPDYLRERFPHIILIENMHNVGFARANNIGIKISTGEYVLLINPDTFVAETTISETLEFMDTHPNAGALGVKMLNSDGSSAMESRRGIPTPMTSFYKMSGLCTRFPRSHRFGRYYMSYLPWDSPQKIEIISGAFCLMRRSALDRVGLLDEDFFMYGEDIDLSYRILKSGFDNWYYPAVILHYKGESTQKSSFRYVHVFYQAMLIFFKKHYGQHNLLLTLPIQTAIYFKALMALAGLITGRIRKSLGFASVEKQEQDKYIFFGSKENLEVCRRMAKEKGLDAQFIEEDGRTAPLGHVSGTRSAISDTRCNSCIVYSADDYGYDDMLRIMADKPDSHVRLGVSYTDSSIIITPNEIIR